MLILQSILAFLIVVLVWPVALILRLIGRIFDLYYLIKESDRIKAVREDFRRLAKLNVGRIGSYLSRNFDWVADPIYGILDYQQNPYTTILRGAGDCDDAAYFYNHLVTREPKRTYAVYAWGHQGHVIFLAKQSGDRYFVGSNAERFKVSAKSFDEAAQKAATVFFDKEPFLVVRYAPFILLPFYPVFQ